jgi:hypothetical protein
MNEQPKNSEKNKAKSTAPVVITTIIVTVVLVGIMGLIFGSSSSPSAQQQSITSNSEANPSVQTQPSTPFTPQPPQVPISQIQVTNLTLGNNNKNVFVGHDLTGTVTNYSDYPINYIVLTVEAYDCPGEVINSGCSHIGEDKGVDLFIDGDTYAQIPPGQTREMSSPLVDLGGMPPIQGNFLWSYTITGVYQYSP